LSVALFVEEAVVFAVALVEVDSKAEAVA